MHKPGVGAIEVYRRWWRPRRIRRMWFVPDTGGSWAPRYAVPESLWQRVLDEPLTAAQLVGLLDEQYRAAGQGGERDG